MATIGSEIGFLQRWWKFGILTRVPLVKIFFFISLATWFGEPRKMPLKTHHIILEQTRSRDICSGLSLGGAK